MPFRRLPPFAALATVIVAGCGGGGGGVGTSRVEPPPAVTRQTAAPPAFETSEYNASYALGVINASSAYARGYMGAGIVAAVLDNGVDAGHPDLAGQLVAGHDVFDNDADPSPASSGAVRYHGTFAAGIIAARKDGKGMHGVAYAGTVMPIKIGGGDAFFSDIDAAEGLDLAVARGARAVNMSFGGDGISTTFANAIRRATDAGVVVVVAAGNSAAADPLFPAALPSITPANGYAADYSGTRRGLIAVGCVDSNRALCSFSNKAGVARDWYVVAPGKDILSTLPGGRYAVGDGTSWSAPFVTGAIMLLLDAFPTLTAAQVVDLLLTTAADLGAPGTDAVYGRGLIDLAAATRPQGPLAVPVGATVEEANVAMDGTALHLGPAFGDALGRSAALRQVLVLDRYQRGYQADLSGAVVFRGSGLTGLPSVAAPRFGTVSRAFADVGQASVAFAEDNSTREVVAGSFALRLAKDTAIAVDLGGDASRRTGLVGSGLLNDAGLIGDSAFGTPYLQLAGNTDGAVLRQRVGGATLKLGSFVSNGPHRPDVDRRGRLSGHTAEIGGNIFERVAVSAQLGHVTESGQFLGGYGDGVLAIADGARTSFAGVAAHGGITQAPAWPNLTWMAQYTVGRTSLDTGARSLLGGFSPIATGSFGAGLAARGVWREGDRLTLTYAEPLRVLSGHATARVPTARDLAGNILYTEESISLVPRGRERDIEFAYGVPAFEGAADLMGNLLVRFQPDNVADADPEYAAMLRLRVTY